MFSGFYVLIINYYAISTERTYCDWMRQYVKLHKVQDKNELFLQSELKVEQFLSYLATQRNVAVSTQNQAINALSFLPNRGRDCSVYWLIGLISSSNFYHCATDY